MRGGVVLAVLLAGILITNLASIALLSQPVLAGCGGPFDPPCFICDNTVCEPSAGENCNSCPEDCGCTGGQVCVYDGGWGCQTPNPCDGDGICEPGQGETYLNCPSDCDPPCDPVANCAGRECGSDGCGASCDPYGWDCPGSDICNNGQCCDNSCPSGSGLECETQYPSSYNDCGNYCPAYWGDTCSGGLFCSNHNCVECLYNWQCPSDTQCKNWGCSSGTCDFTPFTGTTCSPIGHPLNSGTCDANGVCVWDGCEPGYEDCDGNGVCDSLNTNQYCGSCDNSCAADESCVNGYCGCISGSQEECWPFALPDRSGVGQCEAGSRTCVNGAYGTCTGGVGPETEVCGNAIDEDCDGVLNNGCACTPQQTQSCYSGPAGTQTHPPCQEGVQTCSVAGQWGECEGEVTPISESCNGVDDDCDGMVDDGARCLGRDICCGGSCCAGQCIGGQCSTCTPTQEVCNGVDDDCDGKIDAADPDMTPCAGGESCVGGACCVVACASTADCDAGETCVNPGSCASYCLDTGCPDPRTTTQVCAAAQAECGSVLDGCGVSRPCVDTCGVVGCSITSCQGTACVLSGTVAPDCPAASTVACATHPEPTNGCGDCDAVTGTLCDQGAWCNVSTGCEACVDNPASGDYPCGDTVRNCRNGNLVRGTNCSPYESCNTVTWTCEESLYAILQEDILVTAGSWVTLQPQLQPNDPHSWGYDGWMHANSQQSSHADVGRNRVRTDA